MKVQFRCIQIILLVPIYYLRIQQNYILSSYVKLYLLWVNFSLINNIQPMNLIQPHPIVSKALSDIEEPMSPLSVKSNKSYSTNYSEQNISLEIKEEEKKLLQDDPYFINLVKKDKQFKLNPYFLVGTKINAKMRARLIKWLQQLIQQYGFKLETYFLAVMILDKYLEKTIETPKDLQLIGSCALYLASKISQSQIVSPEVYVYSSGDCFGVPSMLQKQKQIMRTLDFNTSFPHVTKFIKALGGLTNMQFQQSQRILIMLQQSVQNYRYSRLQLARMIILLVKSGCQATSMDELNMQVQRLQNLIDF